MSKSTTVKLPPVLTKNLGVTKNEGMVLLPIISGGHMTIGSISVISGLTLRVVQKALTSLENKGLIKRIDGVVPLYRAHAPILSFSESLSNSLSDIESISRSSKDSLSTRINEIDNAAEVVITSQKSSSYKLNSFFEQFESNLLEIVQNEMEAVVGMTDSLLTDYSASIEGLLTGLDTDLDQSVGTKLTGLQTELDLSQAQLDRDLKKILRQTKQWLKKETKNTTTSIAEVSKKTNALLNTIKESISESLKTAKTHLTQGISSISGKMELVSLDVSNKLSVMLTSISQQIEQQSNQFDADVSEYILHTQGSLDELFKVYREVSDKRVQLTENTLRKALESTQEFGSDIESWQTEVTSYMGSASQTVIAQLDQIAGTDRTFLDVVKNILSGHLDKTKATIIDEYSTLRSLTRSIGTETDAFLNDARSSGVKLLQKQVEDDMLRLEQTKDALQTGLDSWGAKATKSIEKKTSSAIEEIGSVLDTESAELTGLTENLTSRLQSAFSTVQSSTSAKNETVLGTIKKHVHEYESSIDSKLSRVVSQYTSITRKQVNEAKELYDTLSSHLNERLAEGIKTLNSEFIRVQKEIDAAISDQVDRIELHSSDMRKEFHIHIEDITRQFINMTKGVEATFNGLLTSQTVEASDLMASAHMGFKSALKAETDSLDTDSFKLQQEFASGIGLKIDTIVESVNALKHTLEDFTTEKRGEVAQSMEELTSQVETTLKETEDALSEVEAGTVKQLGDNLFQVSKEFDVSVSTVRDNIFTRLTTLHEDADAILTRSSSGIKTTVDRYISEEQESKQRLLAATSKKIDSLAARGVKSADKKTDAILTQIDENETTFATLMKTSHKDVMKSIEARRNEAGLALDTASIWLETAVSNISGSLDTFGSKITNDMHHVQNSLSQAADETATKMKERVNEHIVQLEEISKTFFSKTESMLRTNANYIAVGSKSYIDEGIDSLSEIPGSIGLEAEQILKQVTTTIKKQITDTGIEVSTSLSDFKREYSLIKDEFKNLLITVTDHVSKSTAATFDDVKLSTVVANQFASRKFESIGLDLKASLSNTSYELIETIRSDVSTKSNEFSEMISKMNNDLSESTNNLISSRVEAMGHADSENEAQIVEWATGRKTEVEAFQEKVEKMFTDTSDLVRNASETINALQETTVKLTPSPSLDTWYLSGNEEAYAHLLDMAQRAKESIVISVLDPEYLDVKILSKIKNLHRQVLVIPSGTKINPATPLPKSWRIWESESPVFIGVMDDEEILIGGQEASETPLFLISKDKSYLKLYHDVIGPKIILSRAQ